MNFYFFDKFYEMVFLFVFQVLKFMESFVEVLCRYVIKFVKNDMEKCWFFYRWIMNNIL